jgi:ADP-heptose:LPS heptosyltransferase
MPDEFWAGDMYAFNLAKKTFPKIPVKFVVNQYFKDIKSEFKKVSVKYFPSKILFLSSPVSISNKKYNFNEFDILKKILQLLADKKSKKELIIRFHPYDEKDKFDSIIEKSEIKVSKSSSKDILEDIAKADVIIGPETMALVISCLCGRKTVSCVTSGKSGLPFAKITKLYQLNKFIYF